MSSRTQLKLGREKQKMEQDEMGKLLSNQGHPQSSVSIGDSSNNRSNNPASVYHMSNANGNVFGMQKGPDLFPFTNRPIAATQSRSFSSLQTNSQMTNSAGLASHIGGASFPETSQDYSMPNVSQNMNAQIPFGTVNLYSQSQPLSSSENTLNSSTLPNINNNHTPINTSNTNSFVRTSQSHNNLQQTQSNPNLFSRSFTPPTTYNTTDSSIPQRPSSYSNSNMEFFAGPSQILRPIHPTSSEESISEFSHNSDDPGSFDPMEPNSSYYNLHNNRILMESHGLIPHSLDYHHDSSRYLTYPQNGLHNIQISQSHPNFTINTVKKDDFSEYIDTGHLSFSNEKETRTMMKERKKKDNHNAIERRRRYHINERITELLTLLPSHDEMKPHKGKILEASVDYIKQLRGEKRQLEDKIKDLETLLSQHNIPFRRHSVDTNSTSSRGPSPAPSPVNSNFSTDLSKTNSSSNTHPDSYGYSSDPIQTNVTQNGKELDEDFQLMLINGQQQQQQQNNNYIKSEGSYIANNIVNNYTTANNLFYLDDSMRIRTDTETTLKGFRPRSDTDKTIHGGDFESSMETTLRN